MKESMIKRIPPHSAEAEQAVVGSMMMDEEAVLTAVEFLSPDDFYCRGLGIVFQAVRELYRGSAPIDMVTVRDKLCQMNVSEEISSVKYLADLVAGVPTSVNVKHYAEIVKNHSVLRRLVRAAEGILEECYENCEPVGKILADTEQRIFDILQKPVSETVQPMGEAALQVLDEISKASEEDGGITGLETGFRELDLKTAGLQDSDLVLIAGRPSMGKTAFVLNVVEHLAMRRRKRIALFSLEMSRGQLVKRLLAMHSHVDAQKLRTGKLSDKEWSSLVDSTRKAGDMELFIDDTSWTTVSEIHTKCRKQKLSKGLDLVIVDYLQLLGGSGSHKNESRYQEISDISRSLKIMAKDLGVPVIALSQLSRAVEQRPDKHPVLSDLRESGAIEQDADIVMFLYRDDYYHPDTEEKNVAEVIIAKQRNGPTGTVKLAWLPHIMKFANLA